MKKEFCFYIIFSGIFTFLFSIANHSQTIQWQTTNITPGNPIYYLESNSSGDIFASRIGDVNTGTVYRTTDMGNSWSLKVNGLLPSSEHILAVNSNNIIFAGGQGGINYSINNGDSWLAATPLITGFLSLGINFNDDIYLSGNLWEGGYIYKSTDNGNSWILINNGLQNYLVNEFVFSLDGYIYAAAFEILPDNFNKIFYSTNAGANWISTNIDLINRPNNLVLNNNGDIFISLYPHDIYRSTDHGAIWELINDTIFSITDITINQLGHIFVSASGYGVFRSTDNGNSWETVNQGLPSLNIHSLTVDPSGFLYAGESGLPGRIFKTTETTVPVELISFTAESDNINVTLNWQTATETNNQGFQIERRKTQDERSEDLESIGFVNGDGTTTEPQAYSFVDKNLSAGKYQYRLKQIDFDGTFEYSNTVEAEINSPTHFSLEQNYPNPFNPSTSIQYAISSRQFVTLKVFDVLGKEVATLVNEEKPAGSYEVEFSAKGGASHLASGIYYYQLKAGDFIETKKMILMK